MYTRQGAQQSEKRQGGQHREIILANGASHDFKERVVLRSARQIPIPPHSHSIVAGGFPEMSYTTREIPGTSLITRCATRSRNS